MAAYKDLQSRNIYSTHCTFASDMILCVVASLLRCDDAGLGLEMNVFLASSHPRLQVFRMHPELFYFDTHCAPFLIEVELS